MVLAVLFAAAALLLSAIGIYGVTSYVMALRTREIAVRMALGARPREVWRGAIGQGMRPVVIGLIVGLMGGFALSRLIGSMLYGVEADDTLTFVGTVAFFAIVGLMACYVPARRATRVDPMVVLRSE
jgi:putative ABC transport system permease protein